MALVHPDSISINVILDPSHFIGAINAHDLSVGGQFNIQIKPQWCHPLTSFDESGIALWFRRGKPQ
jgi:hypothetical protein